MLGRILNCWGSRLRYYDVYVFIGVSYLKISGDEKAGRMAQIQEKKMNSPKFIKCHPCPVVEY